MSHALRSRSGRIIDRLNPVHGLQLRRRIATQSKSHRPISSRREKNVRVVSTDLLSLSETVVDIRLINARSVDLPVTVLNRLTRFLVLHDDLVHHILDGSWRNGIGSNAYRITIRPQSCFQGTWS